MSGIWTEKGYRLWEAADDLTVSEWADRYRRLSPRESAEPGLWRTSRVPYLRQIMDDLGDLQVDEVVVCKCTQAGVSEAVRNALAYWIDRDPGPVLLVLPDRVTAHEIMEKRIKVMVETCLEHHTTGRKRDLSKGLITLDTCDIFPAWSGSASSLANRPIRYAIFDEVDKYQDVEEGNPVSLGEDRTRTFIHRKKLVKLSSPTTPDEVIWQAFQSTREKRYWLVPCPDCGACNRLTWPNVTWPERPKDVSRVDHAEKILEEELARYRCPDCGSLWDESTRLRVVRQGHWSTDREDALSVAYHISSLMSPWSSLSELAAKWLKAQGHPGKMKAFVNSELGEPWEQQIQRIEVELFDELASMGHPRYEVPTWAGQVVAAIDTQKRGFYYVARAFGRGGRSRLIDHGQADSFGDLEGLILKARYPIEGTNLVLPASVVGIDSGGGTAAAVEQDASRTDQVYRWSFKDSRIRPLKGHGGRRKATIPIRKSTIRYDPPDGADYRLAIWVVDPNWYKDLLAYRLNHKDDNDDPLFEVHSEIGNDYARQMTAEHQVVDKDRLVWRPISEGRDNHYWDCETMAQALAEMSGANLQPTERELVEQRKSIQKAHRDRQKGRRDDNAWVKRSDSPWI